MVALLYDLLQSGAKVNAESEQQILRVSELRIIMEKLLTDWDLLMNCPKVTADDLFNTTFKKGIHFFKYYSKLHGEAKSKKQIKDSIRSLASIQERLE
eukprot:CAMPEP_0170567426 /NCGR_PEP_ID=MMETSP0211-20121228/80473_1 /TAXON_ID=311385 /ORGANISM="Pseudokeronopsis sp., Strain OXSARD2" /LENGTH=97 /DNA_ID=CAMNT_0010888877 /DNA_START=1617 /DNA_END=1910 /DNA_ORIENTATION=-